MYVLRFRRGALDMPAAWRAKWEKWRLLTILPLKVVVALLFSCKRFWLLLLSFCLVKSFQIWLVPSSHLFICLVCLLSTSVLGKCVFKAAFHNWLALLFFIWIPLSTAETSGLCQGLFSSTAVLVNKPWGSPAKHDLCCCRVSVFTKYYYFDNVLEDMFLLCRWWPGSPNLPPDGHIDLALRINFFIDNIFLCVFR